jgi:pimeloyl-ACP methyl ester carboxylesterase
MEHSTARLRKKRPMASNQFLLLERIVQVSLVLHFSAVALASPSPCPAAQPVIRGTVPTRLLVIVPATAQNSTNWRSFLERLGTEPEASSLATLIFEHGITATTAGHADRFAELLSSCIQQKVSVRGYQSVTLMGHSIGGMLARRAYLLASGAVIDRPPSPNSWADRVDKILLVASVNRGIRMNSDVSWWFPAADWLLRTVPHPQLVLEDFMLGSAFIADTRIAWIRLFGRLNRTSKGPPQVVQFWGTEDSVVNEADNADLAAFSGPVLTRIPGAKHSNIRRLEPGFAADPASRWLQFREQLFGDHPSYVPKSFPPKRVLFIVPGIRDSTMSHWVSELGHRAESVYGRENIEEPEYGYFSAAHFAVRPLRREKIKLFRDRYSDLIAENPETQFDFIGHSNGTYIFGHSLLSTPSMTFRNVVLIAPVLPTDFDWNLVFNRRQVYGSIRYDAARWDWPVGILCPALRALGFSDVGPSGVVLFGDGTMDPSRLRKVGWYDGGHGEALRFDPNKGIDNLQHSISSRGDLIPTLVNL